MTHGARIMRRRKRRKHEIPNPTPVNEVNDDRSWFDRRPRLTLVIGVALTVAVMGLMYDAWRDPRPIVVQDRAPAEASGRVATQGSERTTPDNDSRPLICPWACETTFMGR